MRVEFFFGPGSRYSYLAATQLAGLTAKTGATFHWFAVLSADLVARTGGAHRSPQEPAYRATDVERWARRYDVPFHEIEAGADWRRWAMACAAAQRLGSAEAFAMRLYREAFGLGRAPLTDEALARLAQQAGFSASDFTAALDQPETAATYDANLERALEAGAFGVPTFVTDDGALFWGQDRLPLLQDHLLAKAGP